MSGKSLLKFVRFSFLIFWTTFFVFNQAVLAQTTFQRTLGTTANEFGSGIILLADGNLVILGKVPEPGNTNNDFCLIHTNSGGSIISSKRYYLPGDQNPVSFYRSVDGGFLIGGEDNKSAKKELFLVKLDQNFDIVWTKRVSHNYNLQLFLIIEDSQANIYIGADSRPTGGHSDIALFKMNPSGNLLWQLSWDYGNNDHIYDIHFAADGTIYFIGCIWTGQSELLLTCVSPDGNIKWEKSIFQDQNYYPRDIIELGNGEILVTGRAELTGQSFVIRMDNTLTPIWSKLIGRTGGNSYLEKGCFYNDTIYILGNSNSNGGDIDLWSMNTDGTINWVKSYGGLSKEIISNLSLCPIRPASDGLYFLANTEGFGSGLSDMYLVKTNFSGSSGCNEQDLQFFENAINYSPSLVTGNPGFPVTVSNAQISSVENISLNLTTLCPLELQADFTSGTQNICIGQTIDFTDLSQNNPSSWLWQFEGGTPTFSTDQNPQNILYENPGSFDVTLIVSDGLYIDTLVRQDFINVAPGAVVNLGDDQSLCDVSVIVLDAGLGFSSYLWSNGSTSQWIVVDEPGTFWVTVTNGIGCSGSDTINILIDTPLAVNLGDDLAICDGSEIVLDAGAGYSSYLWSNGSASQSIVVENPGDYWVFVTNGIGCSGSDTINVSINASLAVNLGDDQAICDGGEVVLDAGFANSSYLWSNGSTNQWIVANQPGIYWVTVTNATGCTGSDTIIIVDGIPPFLDLGDDIQICSGNIATLGPAEQYEQYLWSTGETSPQIIVDITGDYWLKVTNAGNCENTDTISVFDAPGPFFGSILFPSPGTMVVNGSEGTPPYEYALENQDFQAGNEFVNLNPGEYVVFIRDFNGCVNDTTAIVREVDLVIPNFFTPNNDYIHDTWEIEGISQYPDTEIRIFDRFGKLLVSYKGSELGWDGKYNNKPAPSDTYWYQISFFDGKPPIAGDVTLKR